MNVCGDHELNISSLSKKSKSKLQSAGDLKSLEKAYSELLGKKGEINLLLKNIGNLPDNERKKSGKKLNQLKILFHHIEFRNSLMLMPQKQLHESLVYPLEERAVKETRS